VQDDGTGIGAAATQVPGLGLRIMRNRAAIIGAVLTIEPAQPTGTLVTCTVPRREYKREIAETARPRADRG
jgi:nitrate/nitrite-specific signal transduction histidine kinase